MLTTSIPESSVNACTFKPGNASSTNENVVASIQRLSSQLETHISQSNQQIAQQSEQLAAITRGFGQFGARNYTNRGRGRYRARGRGNNRGGHVGQNSRGGGSNNGVICYRCGGPNHFSKHCQARAQGNE